MVKRDEEGECSRIYKRRSGVLRSECAKAKGKQCGEERVEEGACEDEDEEVEGQMLGRGLRPHGGRMRGKRIGDGEGKGSLSRR